MVLALWIVLGLRGPAPGAEDPVDAAIETANTQAAGGSLEDALDTIREARRGEDHPSLIFVEAQLLRLNGDCATALKRFDEFLATDPPAEDRRIAQGSKEKCATSKPVSAVVQSDAQTTTASPRPRNDAESPRSAAPPAAGAAAAPADSRRRRSVDKSGVALFVSGGLVTAAGIGLFTAALVGRDRARRGSPGLESYLARERRVAALGGVGLAALSVGVGILLTAAIRQAVLSRRSRSRSRHAVAR